MLARAAGPRGGFEDRFTRAHLATLRADRSLMWIRTVYDTKLDRWMHQRDVKPSHLATRSGYSRQHLLRIRKGTMEPTRPCIKAIVRALRAITHEEVKAADVFDLDS